ncbi:PspC domain-containing protein [Desulfonatronovibrio hydrogenovorans]|uniref:PspC domain-containing protein n=1 Tax=Desulfonatronovibrio hydrogenovorans TaxID=53245 RepID=UPI00054F1C80|nr:PspC domain-containing protein [Desulfonatronovibrio hydrogenovorans]
MKNYYRLQDEALVAGVTAGIAEKKGIGRVGLRISFFLIFVLINLIPGTGMGISMLPLLVYVVAWMLFPARGHDLTDKELEKKIESRKAFYNYSMLGVTANLVPLIGMGLFYQDQFLLLLFTVPTFILLLPATVFIIYGIIRAG